MATNVNSPYGFQPVQRLGAAGYRGETTVFAAPTTNALFLGDPVIRIAATAGNPGSGYGVYQNVDLVTQASNHKVTGIVVGFLGSSPNGAFLGFGLGNGPMYKATNTSGQYVVVATDPQSEFAVQCTGNPAATVVGKNTSSVSGTGSKVTGWSGWQVSATTAASATAQFTIVGFLPEVDNVVGSQFSKLIVRINNTTEGANTAGI